MTTASQTVTLPVFYKDLIPLNSRDHATWRRRKTDKASWLANQHAVPLAAEEFPQAQRHFPVIFSSGKDPIPLALMGLNEGTNVFVDEEGVFPNPFYIPAYAQRYPFILARLTPEASAPSLCFDPSTDLVGDFADGEALFDGATPSEACKEALNFCEQFEISGQKTTAFMAELIRHDLLMEGEVAIQREETGGRFVYRGFQIVNQAKLHDLPGEVLRTWNRSGILHLIFAHLQSLELMRDLFVRQTQLGKVSA